MSWSHEDNQKAIRRYRWQIEDNKVYLSREAGAWLKDAMREAFLMALKRDMAAGNELCERAIQHVIACEIRGTPFEVVWR